MLSLKNIKVNGGQETTQFTASIYLGKKKIGEVSNAGVGGCNRYDFKTPEDRNIFYKAIEDERAGEFSPMTRISHWVYETHMQRYPELYTVAGRDADSIIDCLMDAAQITKHFSKKTLFVVQGEDEPGCYRMINKLPSESIRETLVSRFCDRVIILNDMEH
jgi:hypothetical protein